METAGSGGSGQNQILPERGILGINWRTKNLVFVKYAQLKNN
jgi:hypothetical protein